MSTDKKARGNASKKGQQLKALRLQTAQAWAKKRKVTKLGDVPNDVGGLILNFLVRRPGQACYVCADRNANVTYHLNAVCKQWYLWVETQKTSIPRGEGGYSVVQRIAEQRLLVHSPLKVPRSHPSTPGISPASQYCDSTAPQHPTPLFLTELAHPVHHSTAPSNDSFSNKPVSDTAAAPLDDTLEAAMACVKKYRDATSRSSVTLLLTRLLKIGRSRLGDKVLQQHVPGGEVKRWRGEVQKVTEVIKKACRDGLADMSTTDSNGRSLAHHACMFNEVSVVKAVLKDNAGVLACDRRGQNALHYAGNGGMLEIARVLLGLPDKVVAQMLQKRDATRSTPLEVAARRNHSLLTMAVSARLKQVLTRPEAHATDQADDDDLDLVEAGTNSSQELTSSTVSSPADCPVSTRAPGTPPKPQQPQAKKKPNRKQYFDACDERALVYARLHDY
ncbi:hypothetical protein DIPPA_29139 [Diplonema papillatum]|nr:hypothetical protein DIPPA_29139 [Diplonema papillatum]